VAEEPTKPESSDVEKEEVTKDTKNEDNKEDIKEEAQEDQEDNIFSPTHQPSGSPEKPTESDVTDVSADAEEEKVSPPREVRDPTMMETIATASPGIVSSTAESEQEVNKFELLEKLLSFLESAKENESLNPVLSGYFCKLMGILFDHKTKQMVSFIY
jgi:hypothetical protein